MKGISKRVVEFSGGGGIRWQGVGTMTAQVQEFLHSFDLLPEGAKRELADEILRRSLMMDVPPLSDEQLVGAAEEIFAQLDQDEVGNAS
jgi:hypothetical protein